MSGIVQSKMEVKVLSIKPRSDIDQVTRKVTAFVAKNQQYLNADIAGQLSLFASHLDQNPTTVEDNQQIE